MEPREPTEEAATTRSRARLAGIAAAVVTAVALIALVVAQSGDGKAEGGDPIETQSGGTTSSTPGDTTSTSAANGTPTTTPGASGAGGATTTTLPPPPSLPSSPDDYQYQVTLSASCVHPGDQMTIVMHLEPEATGAILVLYSDHQSHEAKHHGVAGPDGRISYTFPVTPTLGKATVYTSAQRRSDNKGGGKSVTFDVVEATRSC